MLLTNPTHYHSGSNRLRDFFDYLPLSNREPAPVRKVDDTPVKDDPSMDHIVPVDSTKAYDMKDVINRVSG
jgi:propionyl-CoA carboxylase beta chain